MKRIVFVVAVAMLGGCGDVDWFPEQPGTAAPAGQAATDRADVGGLVASVQQGPGDHTVTTTKGVFATYTSLDAPPQTNVCLEKHTDPATGLLIGRMLRALQKTILVKDVLMLAD